MENEQLADPAWLARWGWLIPHWKQTNHAKFPNYPQADYKLKGVADPEALRQFREIIEPKIK